MVISYEERIDMVIVINSHTLFYIQPFHRKDAKKVAKLEAMIPYHEGRKNDEEVTKLKEQIASIWEKAKEASWQ